MSEDSFTPVVITPYRWSGEADCLVGPFQSLKVARFFAENLTWNEQPLAEERLIIYGEAWYLDLRLEATPLEASEPVRDRKER